MTAIPDRARLVRVPLPGDLAPERAPLLVAGDRDAVALVGGWCGSRAICASEPLAGAGEDPFTALDHALQVDDAVPGAVGGGWLGHLGYALARRLEPVPPAPPRPAPLPDHTLAFHDHVLRCDAAGAWWFEALWTPGRAEALDRRLELLRGRLAAAPAAGEAELGPLRPAGAGPAGHEAAVAWCRERIAEGDLFQANLCLRLEAPFRGEAAALAVRVLEALGPSHGAYLEGEWGAIVSASPELFLRREGRTVRAAPVKGTAPVGDPEDALASSAKDRAENVMIVDLMRNDLGRVCDFGSVEVRALCEPRETAGVRSLVSELEGRLREDVGDGELVRATFPPGSVTGAPKVQAMRLIHELEATGREAYTGAVGISGPLAGLELSVAIRTIELSGECAWLGVGGGITWSSDPAAELEECLVKARPIAAAAGTRIETEAAAPPRPGPPVARGERPDPEQGVLTTLRCEDGHALFADRHLARLAADAQALWGADIRDPAQELLDGLAERTRGAGPHRARLIAAPGPGGVELRGELEPQDGADAIVHRLVPVALPGGLGARKWRDRRLLARLSEAAGGSPAVPLLVDLDGAVLEAAWGSVFAVEGDELHTPPADGRILPGTCRAVLLEAGRVEGRAVRETPLTLERLAACEGVILTSGVRLASPARLGDGPEPPAGLAEGVRDALLVAAGQERPRVAVG